MPISTKNPAYEFQTNDWRTMRDVLAGEKAIRRDVLRYLPAPPGMNVSGTINLDDILNGAGGDPGAGRYGFYASFAEFPDITSGAVNAMQGLIHEKPPTVNVPAQLDYLVESATPAGDTLLDLWEQITREIFSAGRISLLSEVYEDDIVMCPYVAESLINWHLKTKREGGGAELTVLEEFSQEPKPDDPYESQKVTRYRELRINPETGAYEVRVWLKVDNGAAEVQVTEDTDEEGWMSPTIFGKNWEEIPLTVINAVEKGYKYGPIPALSMAKRALSVFRKSADYHRALYIKGDPQAVLFGVDEANAPSNIGGGSLWCFPNTEGSAMYLDIDGQGIPLMRESINDQYDRFAQEAGILLDDSEGAPESGEAIRRRQIASHVTVKSIVINAAAALQYHLRQIGKARGLSDAAVDAIEFIPNTDFAEPLMSGRALLDYVLSKNAGAPMAAETIHELMRRHRVTDKTFEEEIDAIEAEGVGDEGDGMDEPAAPAEGENDDGGQTEVDDEEPEGE